MAQKRPHLVALLTPVGMGMHGQVITGLMDSAPVKNDQVRIYHFFSRGLSEEAIRESIEQILESRFSALVTIGVSCALAAKKVLEEKNVSIPHIFVGVHDPFAVGLGENEQDLVTHNMTGVLYTPYETERAMQFLCQAKPQMKSLLVVTEWIATASSHLRSGWADEEVARVKSVCMPHGVKVEQYPAPSLAQLYTHIQKNIESFDALVLLEGTTCLNIYESLGDLCTSAGKTLFSGLIEPVMSRAAIGYGASYESLGEQAAQYLQKLLVEGVPLSRLPLHRDFKGRRPVFNTELARHQGLDAELLPELKKEWPDLLVF